MSTFPASRPNFDDLLSVLWRKGAPARLPFAELLCDYEMKLAFLEAVDPAFTPASITSPETYLDFDLRFWRTAGYDYITFGADVPLPKNRLATDDTAALKHEQREWVNEQEGILMSWADFERYPWPKPEEVSYRSLEYLSKHLPDGMKIFLIGPSGQFENLTDLVGLAPLSMLLADDPALVRAISDRLGELLVNVYTTAMQIEGVGAVWLNDDLGYKTSTMISPKHLRQYVFPVQKRIVEAAHARNLPVAMHCCGNLDRIMDDLIDGVGIDAKHSFEDVILPVTEAKRRYGSRIALLGGVDMHFLCSRSEDEVRQYTRRVIEACAPGGGYALGTGNTVANYIPLRNYLAMLEEGRR